MRSEDEITALIVAYEEDLAAALSDPAPHFDEQELMIFALMEKLEVLFWLIEQDAPTIYTAPRPGLYH